MKIAARLMLTVQIVLMISIFFVARGEVPRDTAKRCGCDEGNTIKPHYVESGGSCGPSIPQSGVYGWVRFSHVSSNDFPGDHDWHDLNFYVALDEPWRSTLASDGNYLNNNGYFDYNQPAPAPQFPQLSNRDERLMEMEWDMKHVPTTFWPTAGDRVWMLGRYIWDCGHTEAYHSEIHPPTAVAFTRIEQDPTGPGGPNALANKTYVYIHGRSGLGIKLPLVILPPVDIERYFDTAVATRDYDFDIDLPPNPDPARQGYARVAELPYRGPNPQLTIDNLNRKVHVHYPTNLGDPSPNRRFGAIIVSGWKAPAPAVTYRNITVDIKTLIIRRRHTPLCQADWRLSLNVNGQWSEIKDTFGVIDSSEIPINKEIKVAVPDTDDARLTIQISGWVEINDTLFGSRRDPEDLLIKFPSLARILEKKLDYEDTGVIGILAHFFNKRDDNFGIGQTFGPPGELSKRFQEVGNKLAEPGKPGEVKDETADSDGDFGLVYSIR